MTTAKQSNPLICQSLKDYSLYGMAGLLRFTRNETPERLIAAISLFVSVIIFCAAPVFATDFTINRFHADLTVSKDASLMVKETIEVQFNQSRHGIYREIPFKYADERGNTITTPLDVVSVTDVSGNPLKYQASRKGNVIKIRIGDPHTYVEGNQTYVINYQVENAILFFDNHDELYWNVTGNYWWATIREASANVTLAVNNNSANLWAACYTGALGSIVSACGYETARNSAEFFTKRNLGPREGFTIAFGWDKGLVSPPSSWEKFLWALDIRENWVFILPFFSLVFMMNRWWTKGRDPKVKEAVTVLYEPPQYNGKSLTPGEVGTLVDEKLDPRDITSTIVGLAVKGYMKIEEQKSKGLIFDSTDYYLSKIKEPDDNLSPFEKILMNDIFPKELQLPGRMVSEMKNEFYKHLTLLKSTLYGDLVSKKYFLVNPEKVRQVYIASGIVVIVFSAIALTWLTSSPKGMIAGFLTGLPVVAFARVMPAKTKAGSAAYTDILGFQEFMSRAEKDRLERMGDKDLFSKFLPYAIALDVVDNWAKAFEGIYQNTPDWYVSPAGFTTFSPYHFSRSITAATSTFASTMFSAPRSSGIGGSGFGGGGSSGGGFGGGGGGSW